MASRIHVLAWLSILLAPGCGGRTEPFEWASGTDAAGGTNAAGVQAERLGLLVGGYCGLSNCSADVDCPVGSACVAHDDAVNYCFLICANKPDCNLGRSLANEANCVSNITFVDNTNNVKACVPPSGG